MSQKREELGPRLPAVIEAGDDILPAIRVKVVMLEESYPSDGDYEVRLRLATVGRAIDVETKRAMISAFENGVICWLALPKP